MKSRFFNVLLDVLFNSLLWLLREKDKSPGVFASDRIKRPQEGGNHA
jgi:hypothetical protein